MALQRIEVNQVDLTGCFHQVEKVAEPTEQISFDHNKASLPWIKTCEKIPKEIVFGQKRSYVPGPRKMSRVLDHSRAGKVPSTFALRFPPYPGPQQMSTLSRASSLLVLAGAHGPPWLPGE